MTADWSPAGYELVEMLGFGTSGEVWRGRERATGQPVAVKRLRCDADGDAVLAQLRRLAVDSLHVLPVRAVLPAPGGVALVTDFAPGGSLDTLLRVRTVLPAAEVVTIVLPLAETLAELHAEGIVHGAVTPSNVLFTGNGRPLLADLGLADLGQCAGAAGTGWLARPEDDVRALARLCRQALAGSPSARGRRAPDGADRARGHRAPAGLPGDAADPAARALLEVADAVLAGAVPPDAAAMAAALLPCAEPAPVRLTPVPADRRPRSASGTATGRRRVGRRARSVLAAALSVPTRRSPAAVPARRSRQIPTRRLALAGGALAGLVLAALLGVAWAAAEGPGPAASSLPDSSPRPSAAADGGAPGPVPVAPRPPPGQVGGAGAAAGAGAARAQDWEAVLGALDSRRSGAFGLLDASLLDQVYAPAARPLAVDRAALRRLAAAGVHAVGLDLQVDGVVLRSAAPRSVVLDVVDRLPAYDLAAGARVVRHEPGRGPARWCIRLVGGTGGWRIQDVRAAGAGDSRCRSPA